jgi:hypothetical protein
LFAVQANFPASQEDKEKKTMEALNAGPNLAQMNEMTRS